MNTRSHKQNDRRNRRKATSDGLRARPEFTQRITPENPKEQKVTEQKKSAKKILPPKTHWKYLPVLLHRWERRVLIIAGLLVLSGAILFGVHSAQTYLAPLPDEGGNYTEGVLGQPERANPILLTQDADRDLVQLLYSGLLRYDNNQQLQPDLAESYEVSEDGKNYTFTLRQDATWHDDEPVTADDVVFTVQLMKDPEIQSPRFADFQSVAVEKLDDFTVKFTLTKDAFVPFLRENTTFGILPKHIWQDMTPSQIPLADENLQVIGSGPFKFKEFRKDQTTNTISSYTIERNEAFYRQPPYLDEITFRYYTDESLLFADLKKGRIEGVHTLSPAQEATLDEKQKERVTLLQLSLPSYFAIFFNQTENEALKDEDVRRALGLSLNRQRIIDEALNGAGQLTDAPILPSFLGFHPEIQRIEENDEEAATLLKEAGWEQEGEAVRQKDDAELRIELVLPENDPFPAIASIIEEEWRALGVQTDVTLVDSAALRTERIRPRNYEALVFGQSIAHDPDPYPFWHSTQREDPGLNLTSYKNPTVDDLLETARKESDEEERAKKYIHFQNELAEDLPALFLYIPTYTYALDTAIQGANLQALTFPSDRFAEANLWYKDVKWRRAPTNTESTD